MKDKLIAISIVVFLVGGAFGFLGGVKFQQTKTSSQTSVRQGQGARQGTGQGRFGASGANRPVLGQVLSTDGKTMTVKLADGSSKIVLLPGSVTVSKTDKGSIGDITTGVMVAVVGTTNSDGSVTAQNVQLNPMFRLGGQN